MPYLSELLCVHLPQLRILEGEELFTSGCPHLAPGWHTAGIRPKTDEQMDGWTEDG